jgi:hypothetical protein
MAISGDESYTVILLATYPADQAAALAAPLRAALLSAQRSATAPDPFDGLPFTLEEKGALKISNRVANALLLTEGGLQRVLQPGEPLLVAAASLSEVDLGDLAAFAEARLRQTEQLTGPWTSSGRGVELEGLAGWELEGQATEKKSGQVLAFYQLVVADGPRNYLIVQAMVDPARAAELLPQFRAVGYSVRKKGG